MVSAGGENYKGFDRYPDGCISVFMLSFFKIDEQVFTVWLRFTFSGRLILPLGFPGGSEVKASACNAGDLGSIPGSGRSPGEGNGNLLQYSCLENPMDRGAWWATVHRVAKSRTRLSDFTFFLSL